MNESDAAAEAGLICQAINMMKGGSARYEYTSDGYGKKYVQIIARIEYVED